MLDSVSFDAPVKRLKLDANLFDKFSNISSATPFDHVFSFSTRIQFSDISVKKFPDDASKNIAGTSF